MNAGLKMYQKFCKQESSMEMGFTFEVASISIRTHEILIKMDTTFEGAPI